MRSENAARALLLVLLVLAGYLMYLIFKPFLPAIAWAAIIAAALLPLYRRLARSLRGREWLAAALISTLVALFILVPAAIAVVEVSRGLSQAHEWLQAQAVESGPGLFDRLHEIPPVAFVLDWAGRYVDLEEINLKAMALSAARALGAAAAVRARSIVSEALAIILTIIVLLLMTAFFLKEGEGLVKRLRGFLPLSEKDKDEALGDLVRVTRSVFLGSILTALVQGILCGIGTAIVGLPSAVTFGAATFFAAFIPAGPVLVWLPAAAWLLFTGRTVGGLILLAWGALIVSSADNLVRPLFIGRGVKIHTVLVFFGVFGGMLAFGLIGLFIGPLIITMFLFLAELARRDWFADAGAVQRAPAAPQGGGS